MQFYTRFFYQHLRRSFSQEAQDRWCIDSVFHGKRGGYFVEFGAFDGLNLSNTALLERAYGWTGVCIEPNPREYPKLAVHRKCRTFNCAVGRQSGRLPFLVQGVMSTVNPAAPAPGAETVEVPIRRLEDILEEAGAPATIDFMSVDVEGFEDEALLGFPFERWRVLALCIERPSTELRARLESGGLRQVGELPSLDSFYVHRDLATAAPHRRMPWTWLQRKTRSVAWRLDRYLCS